MAKELTKIVFNEKDLKQLIADKYNLNPDTIKLSINHWKGDQREPEYTEIIAEGEKKP